MYYIEEQDPILVKMEVLLDLDTLRKLHQDVILRFGQYVHKSYHGTTGPYGVDRCVADDYPYIRNYSESEDGESGLKHYEYDEFVTPELTKWIRRLMDGDASAIDELKKGPSECRMPYRDEGRQRMLHRELQELLNCPPGDMDPERFWRLTEEIRSFYRGERDEEYIEELEECYRKALDCVKFKPVMTLYKDKLNEFRRIYNDVRAFYQGTGVMDFQ